MSFCPWSSPSPTWAARMRLLALRAGGSAAGSWPSCGSSSLRLSGLLRLSWASIGRQLLSGNGRPLAATLSSSPACMGKSA
nr:MAG TPA: hypothetical protein [Caudoviricetes sp.]